MNISVSIYDPIYDKETKISTFLRQRGTKMLKKERQDGILEIIKERRYCTVKFLSQKLFVAPITVRRDLADMEQKGLVTRCYGGATVPDYENREVPFEVRNKSNFSIKESIAKKAAKLICDGDVVFLDASSTVSHIVDFIFPEQNLTVITNSTFIVEKLKEKHIHCYLTGGMPIENSYALVGSVAEQSLENFYANICFFSAQGIDENGVISDQSEAESALRRLMLKNSKKQYFIFDSSKYGKRFGFKLASASEISGVVTDMDSSQICFK